MTKEVLMASVFGGGSGGGGGTGGSGVLIVTRSKTETGSGTIYTLDKTAGEIIDAMPLVYIKSESTDNGDTMTTFEQLGFCNIGENKYGVLHLYQEGIGYMFPVPYSEGDAYVAPTLNDYPEWMQPK
ncbi:MAG: hypothetical protein IKG01_14895 [Lachnospiraceae bacterium]|nr:hypothetical protein [Lachnospiraceae bacterium]